MAEIHQALKQGPHQAMLNGARLTHALMLWPLHNCRWRHHDGRQLAGVPGSYNKSACTVQAGKRLWRSMNAWQLSLSSFPLMQQF